MAQSIRKSTCPLFVCAFSFECVHIPEVWLKHFISGHMEQQQWPLPLASLSHLLLSHVSWHISMHLSSSCSHLHLSSFHSSHLLIPADPFSCSASFRHSSLFYWPLYLIYLISLSSNPPPLLPKVSELTGLWLYRIYSPFAFHFTWWHLISQLSLQEAGLWEETQCGGHILQIACCCCWRRNEKGRAECGVREVKQ